MSIGGSRLAWLSRCWRSALRDKWLFVQPKTTQNLIVSAYVFPSFKFVIRQPLRLLLSASTALATTLDTTLALCVGLLHQRPFDLLDSQPTTVCVGAASAVIG